HHARALGVTAIVDESLAEHGVEDAAVDRLQTVARVRQGAPDDDRHGVGHGGLAHLVLGVDRDALALLVHAAWARQRTLRALAASWRARRRSSSNSGLRQSSRSTRLRCAAPLARVEATSERQACSRSCSKEKLTGSSSGAATFRYTSAAATT